VRLAWGCYDFEVPVDTYLIKIFEINLLWAFFHNFLDVSGWF